MSEFEQFDVRSEAETSGVVAISDVFLPAEAEPVVGPDGSLSMQRTYEWGDALNNFAVVRSVHEDGLDKLAIITTFEDPVTRAVKSTVYQLNAQNGRFLVTKEIEDSESILKDTNQEVNSHQLKETELLEFELGLLKPDVADWGDFVALLLEGAAHKSKANELTGKQRAVAGKFGRLRSFFNR